MDYSRDPHDAWVSMGEFVKHPQTYFSRNTGTNFLYMPIPLAMLQDGQGTSREFTVKTVMVLWAGDWPTCNDGDQNRHPDMFGQDSKVVTQMGSTHS